MGEWYFPDGSLVPGFEGLNFNPISPFVRKRGLNDGRVNLFRAANAEVTSPVGFFCCEIPGTNGVNQTTCAVVGKAYHKPRG